MTMARYVESMPSVTDRAAQLAAMADYFMSDDGGMPQLPHGCTGFTASLWPEHGEPREIHFSATWPSATLVCLRSLDGYSLEGGLHRVALAS